MKTRTKEGVTLPVKEYLNYLSPTEELLGEDIEDFLAENTPQMPMGNLNFKSVLDIEILKKF